MSDAVLVSVAKAITKELDAAFIAGTFGAQYREQRAERIYADWDEALEDLDTLHVDVVPVGPGNPKLVDTADLVLAGEPTLPAKGDRIEEIDAGQKHIYEVLPLGGEQHWRYSDPYRRTLRIHTKLIATEAV